MGKVNRTRRAGYSCRGKPSPANYGNGCKCVDCLEEHRKYQENYRQKKRKAQGGVRRDTSQVEHDAFTREQILTARGMK
jgi:hypothetical protein